MEQTTVKIGQSPPLTCKLYLKSVVYSEPPEILPARGTRPNENNWNVFLKKNDSKECKTTIWSSEK